MRDYTLPTNPTVHDLAESYVRDERAALRPCLDCAIRGLDDDEREAFFTYVEAAMQGDPTSPPFSPVQQRRISEKLGPLIDSVMSDPSVIAARDQDQAAFRDTPWWKRRYFRARLRWAEYRYGLRGPMRFVNRLRRAPWD
jgi:hypothetical protein